MAASQEIRKVDGRYLGDISPAFMQVDWKFDFLKHSTGRWIASSYAEDKINESASVFVAKDADTEANARAKMLIYLIENNFVTV